MEEISLAPRECPVRHTRASDILVGLMHVRGDLQYLAHLGKELQEGWGSPAGELFGGPQASC